MKKSVSAFAIIIFTFYNFSCKKENNSIIPYSYNTYIIETSFIPGEGEISLSSLTSNAWGIMETSVTDANYISSGGDTVQTYYAAAAAIFHSKYSFNANPGKVTVNNYELDIPSSYQLNHYDNDSEYINQSYINNDTLSIGDNDNWVVTTGKDVPDISYSYDAPLPKFTGTLPQTIQANTDFTFKFDASNTVNADSAVIIVYQANNYPRASNAVSTTGGIATINGEFLSPTTIGSPSSNTYIEVLLYRYTVKVFGNKQYVFAKVYNLIRSVNID